jgi:nitroreductase
MNPVSPKNQEELLLSRMRWRYSPKSFDAEKKIPDETWAAISGSLVLTSSSYGLQPWKFLVIRDPALREKLRAASWNQRQVTECSHYVVFAQRVMVDEAYVDSYLQSMAEARQQSLESLAGLKKSIMGDIVHGSRSQGVPEWAAKQVYIALGNMMTSAAVLGVDTCPMEGFDPARYDEILGLSETPYRACVACAAGYRNPADPLGTKAKVRFPAGDILQNY